MKKTIPKICVFQGSCDYCRLLKTISEGICSVTEISTIDPKKIELASVDMLLIKDSLLTSLNQEFLEIQRRKYPYLLICFFSEMEQFLKFAELKPNTYKISFPANKIDVLLLISQIYETKTAYEALRKYTRDTGLLRPYDRHRLIRNFGPQDLRPLLLLGEPGTGKTEFILFLASIITKAYQIINCASNEPLCIPEACECLILENIHKLDLKGCCTLLAQTHERLIIKKQHLFCLATFEDKPGRNMNAYLKCFFGDYVLRLLPLRERFSCLKTLCTEILQKQSKRLGLRETPVLDRSIFNLFMSHSWPHNLYELSLVLEELLKNNPQRVLIDEDLKKIHWSPDNKLYRLS